MSAVVTRSLVALLVICSLVMGTAPAAAEPPTTATPTVVYAPPVDAPVTDPFRPPSTPYGPGNRGVEYGTTAHTAIAAAADGVVTFAGVVAGRQWVTIRHADGVRTTYGPLATIEVHVAATVRGGDTIGTAQDALLFTARLGDAYIDPSSLFESGLPRVRLVPEPLDTPQFRFKGGGGIDLPGADALRAAVDWEYRHLAAAPEVMLSLTPAPALVDAATALVDWHAAQSTCTSGWTPVPPAPKGRRFTVLVGGLGSTSISAGVARVDTTSLGYRPQDVVRFSYAGGRTPPTQPVAPELRALAATDYSASDTTGDLEAAGHRLAELLLDVARSVPADAVVDVIAHSQGGLVARVAVAELAASHPDALRRLDLVVTLATPHQGADLAEVAVAADANPLEPISVDDLAAAAHVPLSADDVAVHQLAPGSDFLDKLNWAAPPAGVRFVSIAARGDVVVPSPRAHLDGAVNVVVPVDGVSAHDHLPRIGGHDERSCALAIAGQAPTCETASDAVIDAVAGGLVSRFEHALAVAQGA